ncbi:8297_t:CDS:2 [Ambispora gerdemannii]|uniref:8297_t:CDS:1 n=1 Tax=Ambispora gerdemannii TaxID=144530 RepID=A0A9N9AT77_9GLOM|nr:8297_t:CDS:2 [Ambispora gerdemannii]
MASGIALTDTDIRVVVALDFGVTFSTFAYANTQNPEIETNNNWPGRDGQLKNPTVLQYDENFNVLQWGQLALVEEPVRKSRPNKESHPVELFKLHLSSLKAGEKPWLPVGLNHVKAITDYLTEMQKLIKEKVQTRWPSLEFPRQIKLILTVPAEWNENTRNVLRNAAYNAGLLNHVKSRNLDITTEPEAAAIHCMSVLKEHNLKPGANFMVVDCGGGTVDITIRQLLENNKLSEITERSGDLCGATFVDREFLRFLGRKLGYGVIEKLKKDNYKQVQYLIQRFFCSRIKFLFDGERASFRTIELDVPYYCPAVQDYVVDKEKKAKMEEADWLIEITFDDVKEMFDPVVQRIIGLIEWQLEEANRECDALFLVGGFSESLYLVKNIKELFNDKIKTIAVPPCPIAAVVRGAVFYGLNMNIVQSRRLIYTYGIEILNEFKPGFDKKKRITKEGLVYRFNPLIKRGTLVDVNAKVTREFFPVFPKQTSATLKLFQTRNDRVRYCNETGVRLLGTLKIDLPDVHLGTNRPIEYTLTFGKMEIEATAKNKKTGQLYTSTFDLDM